MKLEGALEKTFRQSDFDRFAALSGDRNPIHVDPDFSARSRFGRTVAHGLLLNTVLRGLLERLVPGGRLEAQSLMFPAPTFADEAMRFEARESARDDDRVVLELRVERVSDGEVTCRGEARLMRDARAVAP